MKATVGASSCVLVSPVMAPAICFFVLGVVSIIYGVYQFFNFLSFDQQWNMQVQMQQANPGVPAAQQQMMQDMMDSMKGPAKAMSLLLAVACNVMALIVIMTGYLLLTLRAKTFVIVGSILSLLPVTYCCLGGLPLGIWTLVILGRPTVKAGFAIARRYRLEGIAPRTIASAEEIDDYDYDRARRLARRRVPLPGLFLIIFGVVGLIVGGTWLFVALFPAGTRL